MAEPGPKKITELWAWICTEADGGEGVPCLQHGGLAMPLFGADEDRIRSFEGYARMVAGATGKPVRLVKFIQLVEVETLN